MEYRPINTRLCYEMGAGEPAARVRERSHLRGSYRHYVCWGFQGPSRDLGSTCLISPAYKKQIFPAAYSVLYILQTCVKYRFRDDGGQQRERRVRVSDKQEKETKNPEQLRRHCVMCWYCTAIQNIEAKYFKWICELQKKKHRKWLWRRGVACTWKPNKTVM